MRALNPNGTAATRSLCACPQADPETSWPVASLPLRARRARYARASDIDRFVAIKGLVIRTSNVIPDLRVGTGHLPPTLPGALTH